MKTVEVRISPAGFDLLQRELARAFSLGYGSDASTRYACARIGYYPKDGTKTNLVVDYNLDGPVWPFLDWPKGWVKGDTATYT